MDTNIAVSSPNSFEIVIKTAEGHTCTNIDAIGGVMVTRCHDGTFQATAFGKMPVIADTTAAAPWVLRQQADDLKITEDVGVRIKAGITAKHLPNLFDLL